MGIETSLLETVNSMILDIITIKELKKMGIKLTYFEWKFNFKNINLIPLLELYDKGIIYKTIESIEFSKLLQSLLKKTHVLYNQTKNQKSGESFLDYLGESTEDCSKCGLKDICPLKDDKE